MCYWGVAFALGPNINAPITEDAAKEAFQAIEQAQKLAASVGERERAYIEALAKRYAADPQARAGAARSRLRRRDARRRQAFPDDLDAATLFAQSLMDTVAVELLGHGRQPARSSPNEVLGVARVGADAQARPHRRDPPVHSRRRSVAQSRPRRGVCRQACRARAGRRPPRAHAGAHLPADRPLQRRVGGEPERDQGGRGRTSPAMPCAGQHDVSRSATTRTTSTSSSPSASMEGRRPTR